MAGEWARSRLCDTGGCLEVRTVDDAVMLRESSTPGIEVVTTAASWQAWQAQARADERAAIVAALRDCADQGGTISVGADEMAEVAGMIERGEIDDQEAGDDLDVAAVRSR